MGSIFSRKKQTTIETLESIERDLGRLEAYRRDIEIHRKHFVGYLLIISVGLYLILILFGYLYYYPVTWQEAAIRLTPLLLFPGFIWLLRAAVVWVFAVRLEINDRRLAELRRERKTILDEVKDKETYKVAKEILERFDPQTQMEKAARERKEQEVKSQLEFAKRVSPGPQIRHRSVNMNPPSALVSTPRPVMMNPVVRTSLPPSSTLGPPPGYFDRMGPPISPRLPRPILSHVRSPMDKVVDYLLGDGPGNRYALICRDCCSHNGMALKEEFEYLAFRCCYCNAFNPARKQKPNAPKVPEFEVKPEVEVRHRSHSTASEPAVRLNESQSDSALTRHRSRDSLNSTPSINDDDDLVDHSPGVSTPRQRSFDATDHEHTPRPEHSTANNSGSIEDLTPIDGTSPAELGNTENFEVVDDL